MKTATKKTTKAATKKASKPKHGSIEAIIAAAERAAKAGVVITPLR